MLHVLLPRLKTRLRDLLLRRLSSSALAMDLDPGPGRCAMPRTSTEILLSVVVAGMARWRSFALQEAERVRIYNVVQLSVIRV